LNSTWNAYWQHLPITVPSPEPAYDFLSKIMIKRFGRVEGLRVLELGAGRGDISYLLAKAGALVTLIDASEIALDQARAVFAGSGLNANFVLADLFESEISQSFDVAMSFGLVEHFQGSERRRLFELHRSGKLGFVSVPNALCVPYRLWKAAKEVLHSWPYGDEFPLTRWELRRDMLRHFRDVQVFTTPLSYNVSRRLGLLPPLRLPIDSWFGYQLIACGAN